MNYFGNQLCQLRQSRKLRQTDMAEKLEISVRHYQDIEYGKVDLPTSKLIALADFFDVSLDYLCGRSEKPEVNR